MKDDLISRKEVIEKLKYLEPFRRSETIFKDIYAVIREIPSPLVFEKPASVYRTKWISVSDKLPPENTSVLIYTDSHFVWCGELIGDTWFLDNDSWTENVLFWAELPEPPKEAKK